MSQDIREIDPRDLHLPTSRLAGADPVKLQRQIARYGSSSSGMPLITAFEKIDGKLVIWDGVTRATRMAQLAPARLVLVEVIGVLPKKFPATPTIGDTVP